MQFKTLFELKSSKNGENENYFFVIIFAKSSNLKFQLEAILNSLLF